MKVIAVMLLVWLAWRYLRPAPVLAVGRAREEAAARKVLGVTKGADADDIRAAHRRLMTSLHPDRGGSPELARQVNAARDTLLAALGRAD